MELTFTLHKSPDFIFDYLTDMDKFASIHPVITRIEKTGQDQYKVYETLRLGFLPFSFTYPATVHFNRQGYRVLITATVFGMTKVEMSFVLKPEGDVTRVEENIHFSSPLPVKSSMRNVFRKQHTLFFDTLNSLSSSGQ